MNIPAGFKIVDQSVRYVTMTTAHPVTLERADQLYLSGLQVVVIDCVSVGGILFKSPAEWRVTCLKMESHGNQEA